MGISASVHYALMQLRVFAFSIGLETTVAIEKRGLNYPELGDWCENKSEPRNGEKCVLLPNDE